MIGFNEKLPLPSLLALGILIVPSLLETTALAEDTAPPSCSEMFRSSLSDENSRRIGLGIMAGVAAASGYGAPTAVTITTTMTHGEITLHNQKKTYMILTEAQEGDGPHFRNLLSRLNTESSRPISAEELIELLNEKDRNGALCPNQIFPTTLSDLMTESELEDYLRRTLGIPQP